MSFLKLSLSLVGALVCLPMLAKDHSLGHPIESVTIPAGAHGRSADGREWICVIANGMPASMTVVDAKTGERLHSYALPYAKQSFSTHGIGDTVYIGTAANAMFYKWDAQMEGGPQLLTPQRYPFGQRHMLVADVGENGNIYMGTYPDALVIEYDVKTQKLRNLGRAWEEASYLKGVSEIGGQLFGAMHAKDGLIQIDLQSGERSMLPYPPGYGEKTEVKRAQRVGRYMFFLLDNDMNVYDPQSKQWVGKVRNASNFSRVAEPLPGDDKAYLVARGKLVRYNLNTHEQQVVDIPTPAMRSAGWMQMNEPDYPGWTLVSSDVRGNIVHYNPQSGNARTIKADVPMNPVSLRAMGRGPDGNLYVGGYLYPMSIARVSADGSTVENLPLPAQIEAMATIGDNLIMGRYPRAGILAYNVKEPWQDGKNPVEIFNLWDYQQDRPFGFAAFGDTLAVGTVPVSGRLGGVLAFYNMQSGRRDVFENVVKDQSIVTLAYKDGLIYGGTSIWGGLGIKPTAEEAQLFIWDVKQGKLVWSEAILPGQQAINALSFDSQGNLWGISGGTIFEFDPVSRKLLRSKELAPHKWDGPYWQSAFLDYDAQEGTFYGSAAGRLFRFNPKDWSVRELTDPAVRVGYFGRDGKGQLYYSKSTELLRVDQD